jgi:Fe-Mn family superoxide dismutase
MSHFSLPELDYAKNALEPYLDEETLTLHHDKHHASYVAGANAAYEKLQAARKSGDYSMTKHYSKELAFHLSGHVLHTLFWHNLAPSDSQGEISSSLEAKLVAEFGSVDNFQKEFTAATVQVEGSGWGALIYREIDDTLAIMQIEKHQDLAQQGYHLLLVCDVWEHAYYLKYQNKRPEWLEAFWNIVNWSEVSSRFEKAENCPHAV